MEMQEIARVLLISDMELVAELVFGAVEEGTMVSVESSTEYRSVGQIGLLILAAHALLSHHEMEGADIREILHFKEQLLAMVKETESVVESQDARFE